MLKETHQKKLDYHEIIDGIFIGTNACCVIHLSEELSQQGIISDVSLEEFRLDAPFGVESYVWIPVKDHTAPNPDQLELGVTVLEKLISLDKKVYVHCKNGHGRAPTLVAAYLIRKGKTPEEAEKLIKGRRPAIHLWAEQRKALRQFSLTTKLN